jgi:hypothetical protein
MFSKKKPEFLCLKKSSDELKDGVPFDDVAIYSTDQALYAVRVLSEFTDGKGDSQAIVQCAADRCGAEALVLHRGTMDEHKAYSVESKIMVRRDGVIILENYNGVKPSSRR